MSAEEEAVSAPDDEARIVLEARAKALSDAQAGPVEGVRNPTVGATPPPAAATPQPTAVVEAPRVSVKDVLGHVATYNKFMAENVKGFRPVHPIAATGYAMLAAPVLSKHQVPTFEIPSPWGEILLLAATGALVAPGLAAAYRQAMAPETPEERAAREKAERAAEEKARADQLVSDLEERESRVSEQRT